MKPGVEFRDVHRLAASVLASGLKELGLMKGDVQEAVEAGAQDFLVKTQVNSTGLARSIHYAIELCRAAEAEFEEADIPPPLNVREFLNRLGG